MPTKKPRYFNHLRAFLDAGESLDQGTARLLAELADRRVEAENVVVRLGEHRMARERAERDAKLANDRREKAEDEVAKAKEELAAVPKARRELAEEYDRRLATLSRQVEDAATHGRMVGGLVGLVVGVVVSALIVAAL